MATTIDKYLAGCQEVLDAKPTYANGKSNLKECDCIGMDKYAFRKAGVSFSTSGTNFTARNQVKNLRKIAGTGDLHIGDVVFKVRNPGDAGYDLPVKYREGGKEYNGDLTDYYHIGTVKSVYPLQIIHMTIPTAKTDTKIGKWAYVAQWGSIYIKAEDPTPEPEPEPTPEPAQESALVWSENGKPVNLRKRPSLAAALVDRVPCGDSVTVMEDGAEWCHVQWNRKEGYMMTRFLILPEVELYTVEIPHLTFEQAEALIAQYPGATMNGEGGGSDGTDYD